MHSPATQTLSREPVLHGVTGGKGRGTLDAAAGRHGCSRRLQSRLVLHAIGSTNSGVHVPASQTQKPPRRSIEVGGEPAVHDPVTAWNAHSLLDLHPVFSAPLCGAFRMSVHMCAPQTHGPGFAALLSQSIEPPSLFLTHACALQGSS